MAKIESHDEISGLHGEISSPFLPGCRRANTSDSSFPGRYEHGHDRLGVTASLPSAQLEGGDCSTQFDGLLCRRVPSRRVHQYVPCAFARIAVVCRAPALSRATALYPQVPQPCRRCMQLYIAAASPARENRYEVINDAAHLRSIPYATLNSVTACSHKNSTCSTVSSSSLPGNVCWAGAASHTQLRFRRTESGGPYRAAVCVQRFYRHYIGHRHIL